MPLTIFNMPNHRDHILPRARRAVLREQDLGGGEGKVESEVSNGFSRATFNRIGVVLQTFAALLFFKYFSICSTNNNSRFQVYLVPLLTGEGEGVEPNESP
jgi:hypothetical protein